MKTFRYSDKQPVRKGDVFTAPRWGTCTVSRFDRLNGCAVAVNLSTGETFDHLGQPTFGESDLIRRKPENITRARMAHGLRRLQRKHAVAVAGPGSTASRELFKSLARETFTGLPTFESYVTP
jgi:hypothetical protein